MGFSEWTSYHNNRESLVENLKNWLITLGKFNQHPCWHRCAETMGMRQLEGKFNKKKVEEI